MKVGPVGETWVQLWAQRADMTVNAAVQDEFGWDFCLQFAPDRQSGPGVNAASAALLPFDLGPTPIKCWVQVKATAVGETSRAITLSNWEKMVNDPFPWFVMHIALSGDGEVDHAALVHIDEKWIEKVQRRLTELDPAVDALNQQRLDVTWTSEDFLSNPLPNYLRERITAAVGDPLAYFPRKARYRATVGYGDQPNRELLISTGLSRDSDTDTETIVDFAIGLTDKLAVSAFTVKDTRFEVTRIIQDKRDLSDAYMQFSDGPPSVGRTTLTFTDQKGTSSTAISFETYTPTILMPGLEPDRVKLRFASRLVSLVSRPKVGAMTVRWNVPSDGTLVPLSQLADACTVLLLFANATADNGVRVTYERQGKSATLG